MQELLAVRVCDRPGFNTKSILLQSAITMCWLKQMASINGTAGPVSSLVAPEEMFNLGRILQTLLLSLSLSLHF